jgi:hypothetical protein
MPIGTYADPFRLRVLKGLTSALQEIIESDDYAYDLSSSVFRGRIIFGADDPLPAVSILEPPLPPDAIVPPSRGTSQTFEWELLLQGWIEDDKTNPTDPAYVLLADVRKRLMLERGKDGNRLGAGNRVTDIVLGSPVVRPSDEISSNAYFYQPITLKVTEDLAHPYD